MNTRLKQFSSMILIVLVSSFISTASAQSLESGFVGKGREHEEKFNNIVKELNLNQEQQQQISIQKEWERQQSKSLREEIKAAREQITLELDKQVSDKAKVYALIEKMKELIGKRIEQKIEGILALKEILTPEQFKALNDKTKQLQAQKRR